jgi:ABC-type arginine transport system permease subunit
MGCLLALLALITPRLVVFLLWLFTTWFRGLAGLWLILGFIFLPTTLLWYTAVQHWFAGQWTLWPIVGLVIALAIDVSPARRGRKK